MKLNKTWMGICVWVIYVVGMIFAIGVTSFVSRFFSAYGQYPAMIGITAVSLLGAFIIAFTGCRIGALFNKNIKFFDSDKAKLFVEILLPVVVIICGVVLYPIYMRVAEVTGNMSLVNSAIVTKENVSVAGSTLLERIYIVKLHVLMTFLGNEGSAAVTFQVVARILTIVLAYIALRNSIGLLGGFTVSVFMATVPVFGYSLKLIAPENLYLVYIWFSLLLLVLWVRGFETETGNKIYYILFDLIAGAMLGFVIYLDPGALSAVAIAFSVFFVKGDVTDLKHRTGHFMFLLISAVVVISVLAVFYTGSGDIIYAIRLWADDYCGPYESAWIAMLGRSMLDQLLGLIALIAAATPIFAYFICGRNERIVPWLIFGVLSAIFSVVFYGSYLDNETYLFVIIAIFIGCGVSCFSYKRDNNTVETVVTEEKTIIQGEPELEKSVEEKAEIEEPEAKEEIEKTVEGKTEIEESETKAEIDEMSQVESEIQKENEEEPEIEKSEDEPKIETEDNSSEEIVEENTSDGEEKLDSSEEKSVEKDEKIRYVPEGMVLPTGDEDEENLEPHFNMQRPEMEDIGMLSLNRGSDAEENIVETEEEPVRDDFDIELAPGDDFDI